VIVDPEGLVRLQAGDGEELLTDVLDLDAVTRVREYGTAGVSRLWDQATRTSVCARESRERDGARQ
jgi:formamidase